MSGTTYDKDGGATLIGLLGGTTTALVTKDSGTPAGQQPAVSFNLIEALGGTFNITSTNGASATVNATVGLAAVVNEFANGGTITDNTFIGAANRTTATISNGGTLIEGGVTLGALSSNTVNFGTGGGTLVIGNPGTLLNLSSFTINNFGGKNDIIDDKAIIFAQVKSYTVTNSGVTQTYTFFSGTGGTGTNLGSFTVNSQPFTPGTYAIGTGPLQLSADGSGNLITESCFLKGTRIATPTGQRAVETIEAGDTVLTASGRAAEVTWAGQRTILRALTPDADLRAPVRIVSHAIAPGVPARDLRVTPDHAILVDGRLIPARLLINGTTIRQESIEVYTYYHLELEAHDLLLAEGLPAESYLDCQDRDHFAEDGAAALRPLTADDITAIYATRGCRTLTLDAASVQPIWQALADRAATMGLAPEPVAVTGDADLHLVARGRRVAPIVAQGDRFVFAVPAGTRAVTLASRAARPSASAPWLDDRRLLGVQVGGLRIVHDEAVTDVALDTPAGRGWHGVETVGGRPTRWTDGAATIALPPQDGPIMLELTVRSTVAYPAEAAARAA